jgi:hypothetical protein
MVPKLSYFKGSILTRGTSLSALMGNENMSYPTPSMSTTMTMSYFLGIREINIISISIVDLGLI